VAECIVGLAACAQRSYKPELAARLFGCAEGVLEALGTTVSASNMATFEALDAELLGPPRSVGRRLLEDDALEQARVLAQAPLPSPGAGLTQREAEVARLLARGLSNRQVADLLVITEKTAKNHAQKVLDKLGLRSRAQVAARADELGLRD
jgi:DNA-binding NarL/FixJ family response regulator